MLIDWFTIGAQALNFLILVWLMRRFLYKPILNAIDAREKLIAGKLADAEARKAAAGKERDAFAQRNQAFDQERAALLVKAEDEAKDEGRRLLDEARTAADALTAKRNGTLQDEARNLHAAISRCAQDEVFAIARKTMADLASASLEERLVAVFERRVRELDEHARTVLCDALRSATTPVVVRSAFDLPAGQREALQKTIDVMCSADIHLRFETAPEVIGGIELTTAGSRLAWSISEYLAALEKSVADLLRKQAATATPAQTPA